MPSHTPDGRGCPAGHRGRTAQGVRHTRRGEGVPIARPEAVEGVAVGWAVASSVAVVFVAVAAVAVVGTNKEARERKKESEKRKAREGIKKGSGARRPEPWNIKV